MNARLLIIFVLALAFSASAKPVKIPVKNPLNQAVAEWVIELKAPKLLQAAEALPAFKLLDGDTEIAYDVVKTGNRISAILAQLSFAPGEKKIIRIEAGQPTCFPKKTQAELSVKQGGEWKWIKKKNGNEQWEYQGGEWKNVTALRVDPKHTDHSFDIRYEGPGWESDKMAFRFYLDWRNACDIFGKKTAAMVLQNVGLDGFDSYHEMSDWGADILKVGDALGIGTIAHWAGGKANRVAKTDSLYAEITENGLLRSTITTQYSGWQFDGGKTDLTAVLSICGGSYLTKCELSSSSPIDNLSTGMIKMPGTEVVTSANSKGDWAYVGTFGVQSLNRDKLGMFIFYRKSQLEKLTEDKLNHVVVMKPENQKLTYYFGGVWELDSSKIDSKEKFEAYLNLQLQLLNAGMIN